MPLGHGGKLNKRIVLKLLGFQIARKRVKKIVVFKGGNKPVFNNLGPRALYKIR